MYQDYQDYLDTCNEDDPFNWDDDITLDNPDANKALADSLARHVSQDHPAPSKEVMDGYTVLFWENGSNGLQVWVEPGPILSVRYLLTVDDEITEDGGVDYEEGIFPEVASDLIWRYIHI